MFGSIFAQCSRTFASTSTAPLARLHTSAVLQTGQRNMVKRKANAQRREARVQAAALRRPHVILGNRPGDDQKWPQCDLAKILVTEKDITTSPKPQPFSKLETPSLPKYMNYGIGEKEKERLFETLPSLNIESAGLKRTANFEIQAAIEKAVPGELQKMHLFATLVDLRNANAEGIAFENRKRIVAAFSEPGKPNDSGRPEVQAALLTMRIRNIWSHMSDNKKDFTSRRSIRRLVHQRAKVLRYLKDADRERYNTILVRCGLEKESVEGELVV